MERIIPRRERLTSNWRLPAWRVAARFVPAWPPFRPSVAAVSSLQSRFVPAQARFVTFSRGGSCAIAGNRYESDLAGWFWGSMLDD